VGTGPGAAGATSTYAELANQGKMLLSFVMLLGRLEIYTVFVIFSPSLWE
jgi:trk system potassium uptake protein TrkH